MTKESFKWDQSLNEKYANLQFLFSFFFFNRNSICVCFLEREHMVFNVMCFNSDIVRW